MWQDWIFAAGGLVFVVVTIPSLLNRQTELCRITSVTTAIILVVFSFTLMTMDMPFGASMDAVGAIMWALLAMLRPIRKYPELVQEIPQFEVTQEEAELVLAHREWLAEQRRRRTGQPEPGEPGALPILSSGPGCGSS